MKKTGFKFKPRKPLRRTPLRVVGHSTTAELKQEIQDTLRSIGLHRDGGCVLRTYPEAGPCGGRRKSDDGLILQWEHLITRSNTATFADTRNGIILCRNHHILFKPQHSSLYWNLIRRIIGEDRWKWMERARDDHMPHKVDLKLELIALKQELKKYQKNV